MIQQINFAIGALASIETMAVIYFSARFIFDRWPQTSGDWVRIGVCYIHMVSLSRLFLWDVYSPLVSGFSRTAENALWNIWFDTHLMIGSGIILFAFARAARAARNHA
jgi:hypothetical protein